MSDADDFVNVWAAAGAPENTFHQAWSKDIAAAPHSSPVLQAFKALREIYPAHSIAATQGNILGFPGLLYSPLADAPLVSHTMFIPIARSGGGVKGALLDSIQFGAFTVAWDSYDFIVYVVNYPIGLGTMTTHIVLHEGPVEPARSLILNAGKWSQELHEEIWVYNQGYWQKDPALWTSVQKASWDAIIMKDEFKKAIQKDVYGFFKSEAVYKDLGVAWKRGLIMHGPPGNGKSITIKAIIKTCDALGFAPLYVKSFQNWAGEEAAMQDVFDKARQFSPCVIILEDLDALINDGNRSFFLNQVDGLQSNDGLLIIGTTNHFDRLDPGLSTRPSRFDRKYLFDDPDNEERALYAKYWQNKLRKNQEIEFPDALINEIADHTDQFSFAYLQEAFVSTLVTLAGYEGEDKPSFRAAVLAQIKELKKQLDKPSQGSQSVPAGPNFRVLLDRLASARRPQQRLNTLETPGPDFRTLLDKMNLETLRPTDNLYNLQASSDADFRVILDRLQGVQTPDAVKWLESLLPKPGQPMSTSSSALSAYDSSLTLVNLTD